MPDQALFAYRVQLPDGSEAVRTGGADRPPTYGELADYSANQGERFLGHVPMSPAPAPTPPAAAVPATVATAEAAPLPSMVAPAANAPRAPSAEAPSFASQARQTLLPSRSLSSEGLSIGGGVLGGMAATVAGPFAPVVAPLAAGAGSALGEAGQVGLENLMGWPAAEPGTLTERMTRAGIRGTAGEGAGQVLRLGARGVAAVAGPTLRAASEVAPALEQAVPAGVKGVPTVAGGFAPVTELLSDPAKLAAAELTPKGQDTLVRMWWQQQAPQGAASVVNAWDQLGTPAQQAMAGGQHEALSTLVDSLRPSVAPLLSPATGGQALKAGVVPTMLTYAGHPHLAAAVGGTTLLGERYAPRALLSPTLGPWLASLPGVADVAAPWASGGLRVAGQVGANEALP
jgi:hypothetical protein